MSSRIDVKLSFASDRNPMSFNFQSTSCALCVFFFVISVFKKKFPQVTQIKVKIFLLFNNC